MQAPKEGVQKVFWCVFWVDPAKERGDVFEKVAEGAKQCVGGESGEVVCKSVVRPVKWRSTAFGRKLQVGGE